jgi:hypothetical protein
MDKLAEIRRLYYRASPATIEADLARAIALLRSMSSDEDRERAAVFMDGLSQLRSEWAAGSRKATARHRRPDRPPER